LDEADTLQSVALIHILSCKSIDFRLLQDQRVDGKGEIYVFDVGPDNKLSNQKLFTDCVVDGVKCGPDGMRCDVNGNVWCSSNAGRSVGYSGVTVWSPEGKLIGRIRLPEICGNVCFGGPKRNRLFMAASQSLYAVYTATQGASPG
jgi:gluconolactonase